MQEPEIIDPTGTGRSVAETHRTPGHARSRSKVRGQRKHNIEPDLPHPGSGCDRDAPADIRRPRRWSPADKSLRIPWRTLDFEQKGAASEMGAQGYRLIDSAGCVIAVFRDLHVAQAVVEAINTS